MELAFKAHRRADIADHRFGDVSDDLAVHPRRYLPRNRRYARANINFMIWLYNPRRPISYIMEVNANNLYNLAMLAGNAG